MNTFHSGQNERNTNNETNKKKNQPKNKIDLFDLLTNNNYTNYAFYIISKEYFGTPISDTVEEMKTDTLYNQIYKYFCDERLILTLPPKVIKQIFIDCKVYEFTGKGESISTLITEYVTTETALDFADRLKDITEQLPGIVSKLGDTINFVKYQIQYHINYNRGNFNGIYTKPQKDKY